MDRRYLRRDAQHPSRFRFKFKADFNNLLIGLQLIYPFEKLIHFFCASVASAAQGEGVRLNRCSSKTKEGRMMTPDEVSSGSTYPKTPRKNLRLLDLVQLCSCA